MDVLLKKARQTCALEGSSCLLLLLGSLILAFGLYNIHAFSGVTEGGSLGLTLLLFHWFQLSPAISSFVLNVGCYVFGWRVLGSKFIVYSMISTVGFSAVYTVCEQFEPIWPQLAGRPLLAAVLGGIFVGVGCGLCVRAGGAPCADDALAMGLAKLFHVKLRHFYLVSDLLILGLSVSYLSWQCLLSSLLAVIISGQIVGWIAGSSAET